MEPAPDRKLTTILSADAAGYSRLMGEDEPGTLATLKSYREAMAEAIVRHRGRVVSNTGDALLAEFGSVVNAVECAVRIQRELAERNATLAPGRRMAFRIGINLGDVLVDGGDLFGEGVNIAARLQALAEPGGVLVSGTVFDQVRNKLSLGFDYLGPQAVKNMAESVPAWRVLIGEEADQATRETATDIGPQAKDDSGSRSLLGRFVKEAAAPRASEARALTLRTPWQRVRRSVTAAAVLIGFLFAVNILSWEGELWFLWPALVILFLLGLRIAWAMGR